MIIVIALVLGAIIFLAGWLTAQRQYKGYSIIIEKPNYITDADFNKIFREQLELTFIKEGLVTHEQNGNYKIKKTTFYAKKED